MKRARLPAVFALAAALAPLLCLERAALAAAPDPAAEAQSLLAKLDAPETRNLVQAPVAKAKAAQQRAQSARGAGDLQHATELDALALTWAKVADDLVRTAESEKNWRKCRKPSPIWSRRPCAPKRSSNRPSLAAGAPSKT